MLSVLGVRLRSLSVRRPRVVAMCIGRFSRLVPADAVAAWLLKQHEDGRPLWKWLYRKLGTPGSFAAMVAYGRQHGLRNDDCTLVRVIHHASRVEAKES